MIFLSQAEIKKAVKINEVIEVIENAFAYYSRGKASVPNRIQLNIPAEDGVALYMPGFVEEMDAFGVKVATIFPRNPQRGKTTTTAVLLVNDTKSGEVLALMEATYLTALRTGAASAVASKYLARENSEVVGIIGTGKQAETQLEAICAIRAIKKVKVFDINSNIARNYIELMQEKLSKLTFELCSSTAELVEGSDIICTTTTSKKPVFSSESISKGLHINAVGAFTPEMQEIGEESIVKIDKICVDSYEAVLEEAGDIIIPLQKGILKESDIYAEIGQIINGQYQGREREEEITLFKTVGLSVQDVTLGSLIYQKAKELKLGKHIELA